MKTEPHLAAYACPNTPEEGSTYGLTKREYFAALAMQGSIANADASGVFRDTAEDAVKFADALIDALNKPS